MRQWPYIVAAIIISIGLASCQTTSHTYIISCQRSGQIYYQDRVPENEVEIDFNNRHTFRVRGKEFLSKECMIVSSRLIEEG